MQKSNGRLHFRQRGGWYFYSHTPKAGSKELDVPLVQMNALLGFVADALTHTILSLGLERAVEVQTLRAFNKLLWLQNDLINRHY